MDEWDLLDEVDVIALWPNEHKKNVESAKWQERKEALEVLSNLMEKNPRLSTASMTIYGELMDNLKKIIAHDSNINVVIAALRVLTRLANGLRDRFSCFISMIWSVVLDKSKDKKNTVRTAVGETLDAISDVCATERLTKDLCEHLSKPNPQSKQCLCAFLTRYFVRQTNVQIEFAKAVLPIVVKLASDSDPSVRDAACNTLGSARRLLGKSLDAFLGPIMTEKAKLDKIEEYCVEATKQHEEFLASRPQREQSSGHASGDVVESEEVGTSAPTHSKDIDPWTLLDPTNVVEKLGKNFDELIVSKKWQERKEAVDSMLSIMESAPRVEMSPELQPVMMTLLKVLEKDVNINVSSACAKVLAKLAVSMRTDFAVMVPKVMPIAFDKLKEKKAVLRNELVELCDAAATTTSLENYTEAVCGGLTKPNPQSRAQTALFVARLLSRHDSSTIPANAVKEITPDLVKCSSDADAEVRESTFRAMGAVLRCVGEQAARRLFGEVSEDKLKMAKITENSEKIREEFGDKAAPEIIRLHAAEAKPKPSQTSAPKRASSASLETRKVPPASRAPTRPMSSASRPSAGVSRTTNRMATPSTVAPTNRVATKPAIAPKRPNVVTSTPSRQNNPVRVPLSTRPTQSSTQRPFSAGAKPIVSHPTPSSRAPARTVFAPNVVRATQPTNKPAAAGPVKISSNSTNGAVPTVNSTEGVQKVTTGLPRSSSGSGLRPPTAIIRTNGSGIPRLSRPSSPNK
ncbi:hypothetical protein V3C99_010638 [Haemonchus contortus]